MQGLSLSLGTSVATRDSQGECGIDGMRWELGQEQPGPFGLHGGARLYLEDFFFLKERVGFIGTYLEL